MKTIPSKALAIRTEPSALAVQKRLEISKPPHPGPSSVVNYRGMAALERCWGPFTQAQLDQWGVRKFQVVVKNLRVPANTKIRTNPEEIDYSPYICSDLD